MTKVRIAGFAVSLDGYAAGPGQDLANPLGVGGAALFDWFFPTKTFQSAHADSPGGETRVDDRFARQGFENIGAWILGRNMFGPVRGAWPDESWKGWWGDKPPYHTPVFVLTHYPRPAFEMKGGTVFHFVTEGFHAALDRATEAAGGQDVRIGGGVATVRQYLSARMVDEIHLAVAAVLLGRGENLFAGMDLPGLGYRCMEQVAGERANHVLIRRG